MSGFTMLVPAATLKIVICWSYVTHLFMVADFFCWQGSEISGFETTNLIDFFIPTILRRDLTQFCFPIHQAPSKTAGPSSGKLSCLVTELV